MQKLLDLFNKFSPLLIAVGAAYWAVVGLLGVDVLGVIFSQIRLDIILRLVYLIVGAAGIIKLIEMFKPELLKKKKK